MVIVLDEIERIECALESLSSADLAGAESDEIGDAVLRWWRLIDRAQVFGAQLLRTAEVAKVHAGTGYRDITEWVASATNTARGSALYSLRLAEVLEASPMIAEAVQSGDVTAATAARLSTVLREAPADADHSTLVDAVASQPPAAAQRAADTWFRSVTTETPEESEARRFKRRSVRFSPPDDGLVTATAILPELDAMQLRRVISFIAGKPNEADGRSTDQRLADGLIQLVAAYSKGEVTGGRERPTMLITASLETWRGLSDEPGRAADGTVVSAHTIRRLLPMSQVQRVVKVGAEVLELGRSVRFATDAQWRALVARDGGCRFPGCKIPAEWCDVDHLVAVEDGGPTDLLNMLLWCRFHHGWKHTPGVVITGDIYDFTVHHPNGSKTRCRLPAAA